MKENFKNKHQTASAKKADSTMDVVKVRQKVESKRRGEGPCRVSLCSSREEATRKLTVLFPTRRAADETGGEGLGRSQLVRVLRLHQGGGRPPDLHRQRLPLPVHHGQHRLQQLVAQPLDQARQRRQRRGPSLLFNAAELSPGVDSLSLLPSPGKSAAQDVTAAS